MERCPLCFVGRLDYDTGSVPYHFQLLDQIVPMRTQTWQRAPDWTLCELVRDPGRWQIPLGYRVLSKPRFLSYFVPSVLIMALNAVCFVSRFHWQRTKPPAQGTAGARRPTWLWPRSCNLLFSLGKLWPPLEEFSVLSQDNVVYLKSHQVSLWPKQPFSLQSESKFLTIF